MDMFKEEVVVSRNRLLSDILYVLCWVFLVVFAVYGVMLLQVVIFAFDLFALVMPV